MVVNVDHLYLRQPITICPRRGSSPGYLPVAKNNALLLSSGAVIVRFNTPVGVSEHLLMEPSEIVTYRSGQNVHGYWYEDLGLELAIANRFGGGLIYTGTLFWEHDGTIASMSPVHPREDLLDQSLELLRTSPVGRMAKNTARALAVCRYCKSKSACDALDRQLGETGDWHTSYPFP